MSIKTLLCALSLSDMPNPNESMAPSGRSTHSTRTSSSRSSTTSANPNNPPIPANTNTRSSAADTTTHNHNPHRQYDPSVDGMVWTKEDEIQAEKDKETTAKYNEWLAGRDEEKVWDELVRKAREEMDKELREG